MIFYVGVFNPLVQHRIAMLKQRYQSHKFEMFVFSISFKVFFSLILLLQFLRTEFVQLPEVQDFTDVSEILGLFYVE